MSIVRKLKRKNISKEKREEEKQRKKFISLLENMKEIEERNEGKHKEIIEGEYADATIYTDMDSIETKAYSQVGKLTDMEIFKDSIIKIMPDVHYGKGAPVGLTIHKSPMIPNLVGRDIGCGVSVINLGRKANYDLSEDNLKDILKVLEKNVPTGTSIHKEPIVDFDRLEDLKCYDSLENLDRIKNSLGTLGGGNHVLELGVTEFDLYAMVHTGSRNLGSQVADFYQNKAIEENLEILALQEEELAIEISKTVERLTSEGRTNEIEETIKDLKNANSKEFNKDLAHIIKKETRENYIHDMNICKEYASLNRRTILKEVANIYSANFEELDYIESIHNYYDEKEDVLRKGAISAQAEEDVVIPISMKEGFIIGVGKGNGLWNLSAPHGAGRLMGRNVAKETVDVEEFHKEMEGIVTNALNIIDEAPSCYRTLENIEARIEPTVGVVWVASPILNYKG